MRFGRTSRAVVTVLLAGCGGGGQRPDGVGGVGGVAAGGRGGGAGAAAGGGSGIGGVTGGVGGNAATTDAAPGSRPSASDLQGAWYALGTVADAGTSTITHRRLRFDGDRYYMVYNSRGTYCAEVGTFQVADAGVDFAIDHVEGYGPCLQGPPRREQVSWTSSAGIAFDFQGAVTPFARVREVPKVFATVETHNGNFAGDAFLPGANAIEKADAFCDGSLAKPDAGRYRAIVWDDVVRSGPPSATWIFEPRTTYFQADGVRNVFTTDASRDAKAHGPFVSDFEGILYAWVGGGCQGWTSASSASTITGALADAAQRGLGGVGGQCNQLTYGMLCVGAGEPVGGNPDGGVVGGDAGVSSLQGSWRVMTGVGDGGAAGVPSTTRLRFDGDTYTLVSDAGYAYCGEVGRFEASAASVRFIPIREEGIGACRIGELREETLAIDATGFTLSRQGVTARYVRADAVPKIFLTLETHGGDFLHDATLSGATAIAKADAFCSQSASKPDDQTYKSTLVDGTVRGASPAVDWVLKPFTTYYQAAGALPMFTSDSKALYDARTPFTNRYLSGFADFMYMWSGLSSDFTTGANTCKGWASLEMGLVGGGADSRSGFGNAVTTACTNRGWGLICVSQ